MKKKIVLEFEKAYFRYIYKYMQEYLKSVVPTTELLEDIDGTGFTIGMAEIGCGLRGTNDW